MVAVCTRNRVGAEEGTAHGRDHTIRTARPRCADPHAMSGPQARGDERGRHVLVTGASGGIGRAIAQRFAADGCRVAVHYASRKDEAAATLASLEGGEHMLVDGDIADPDAAERIVAAAVDGLGGLDVLVNNAAAITLHPLPETSYADWQAAWQRTIGVNVLGSANVSYCAARSEAHTSELQSRSQLVCRHLLYNNTTHTS